LQAVAAIGEERRMGETDKMSKAMRAMVELRREVAAMPVEDLDCRSLERRIQEAANAIALETMEALLDRADARAPEVVVNGQAWGNRRAIPATYTTMFGTLTRERGVYQQGGRGAVIVPLDLRLGIVEGRYTPQLARVMTHATGLVTASEAEGMFEEVGVARVSVSTLHRVPRAIAARYEERREIIEKQVRERDVVPDAATTVQVALDGVMVPQDGELTKPRGRKTDKDPEPPRHEIRYGSVGPTGTAANDGTGGRAWHEASVGTLAFYDAEGRHLRTTYLGRMPEPGKATLADQLEDELMRSVELRPDLNIVFASDGAPHHWTVLEGMEVRLPLQASGSIRYVVDFYHVAEHLGDAAHAIEGEGPAARVILSGWLETLKEFDDGAERVLKSLRYHRDRHGHAAGRKDICEAIDYLAKQTSSGRTRYAEARAANCPIGTGVTEAAAKTVVNVRMKRAGARYSQHGGQTVMLFRTALLSERFDGLSDILETTYRTHVKEAA
jgi:hypothetical protein